MVEPWKTVDSEVVGQFRIFQLRRNRSRSPRTGQELTFFVLEAPDWVNVIPLTTGGNVVMVRQYRHGTAEVTLELPAGMVDATDDGPHVAAARELREETGYAAASYELLGSVTPNPAFMSNRCHTYLAGDARLVGPTEFDGGEDIVIELVPLADIPELIANGAITHSLTISAFHYYDLYRSANEAEAAA